MVDSKPATTVLERKVATLERQIKDMATQFDHLTRRIGNIELNATNLHATVHGHTSGVNCPNCHAKYRGTGVKGQRGCGCGKKF